MLREEVRSKLLALTGDHATGKILYLLQTGCCTREIVPAKLRTNVLSSDVAGQIDIIGTIPQIGHHLDVCNEALVDVIMKRFNQYGYGGFKADIPAEIISIVLGEKLCCQIFEMSCDVTTGTWRRLPAPMQKSGNCITPNCVFPTTMEFISSSFRAYTCDHRACQEMAVSISHMHLAA